jgi:23S rRNA pseudouridine2604 synthase
MKINHETLDTAKQNNAKVGVRINKYLAEKKYSTRRGADELISKGLVFVNGKVASLGQQVAETDKVEIRGKQAEYRYFLYNKPVGIVTSTPQEGEKDIAHHSKFPIKVFPIGRLDKDSSGLIMMTNDGRITKELLSPEENHEKEYAVTVNKMLSKEFVAKMERGVLVEKTDGGKEGYKTKSCKVKITGDKTFTIILTEGKNRQIRRMCEALGYRVTALERFRIGKFLLGKLKPGEWREIKGVK